MAGLVMEVAKEKFPDKNPRMVFVDPKKLHGTYFAEAIDKVPYIQKIKKMTGWKPKISARQVFAETIDFYARKIENGYFFKVL